MGARIWTPFQSPASFIFLASLIWILQPVLAIHVVPGSNCTALCLDQIAFSNTTVNELVCYDEDYNNSDVGKSFQECVGCEIQSETFNLETGQTDVGWALFNGPAAVNMRYTLSWCLFGFPVSNDHDALGPCSEHCGNLSGGLEKNILNFSASTPYDYCDDFPSALDVTSCAHCYARVKTQFYLSNFLNLLNSACERKILPPEPFPIKPSQIFTIHPPANYSTVTPNSNPSTGLSRKAKIAIGIAVSVSLLFLLSLLILYWYLRLYRRINQHDRASEPQPGLHATKANMGVIKSDPHWSHHPTVFHPTPRLRQVSYPHPLRSHFPHVATHATPPKPRPEMRVNSTIGAISPRSSPPPRVPRISRSSTRSAMRGRNWRSRARMQPKVSFDTSSGRTPPKKKKRTGWKEPASLEDLFG